MKASEQINEIAKAICLMQSEMQIASKDTKAYNYKYADFSSVWNVLREPLTKNGLMVVQNAFSTQEGPSVITKVVHTSGQWIETDILSVPVEKKGPQAYGSGLTYAKRYQLCALLGIVADEDDDALKASAGSPQEKAFKKEALSDDEYNAFLLEWSDVFTEAVLLDFIKTKASKFKTTPFEVVAKERKDIELFRKNVEAFIKWKEKIPQQV